MHNSSTEYSSNSSKFLQKLNQAIEIITKNFDTKEIYLFGSFAHGTNTKGSSIDLFIVANTTLSFIERLELLNDQFGQNHVRAEPIVYTPQELEKKVRLNDSFISNIIETGKVIYPQEVA